MLTFKPTIYIEQPMRKKRKKKPQLLQRLQTSLEIKISNCYLHLYLVWQGTENALLKKSQMVVFYLYTNHFWSEHPLNTRSTLEYIFYFQVPLESSRVLSIWLSYFWYIFSWVPDKNINSLSITLPPHKNKNKLPLIPS